MCSSSKDPCIRQNTNHGEVQKMICCHVKSLTHRHTCWIRHKLVRNETQIYSLSGVSSQSLTLIVRAGVLPLGVCWEQITVHFNWTIIIHDRHRDQVNMSSLTRWRGARIYCTCLGSINKVELKPPMNLSVSHSLCLSPDGGASAVLCNLSDLSTSHTFRKIPPRVHRCYKMLMTSLCAFVCKCRWL